MDISVTAVTGEFKVMEREERSIALPARSDLLRLVREGVPELPGEGGTAWTGKVADFISNRRRLGNRIKLREVDSVTDQPFPCDTVNAELSKLSRVIKNGTQYAAGKAHVQYEVLSTCLELATARGGTKPSVVQVLAALALRPGMGGIDGELFKKAVAHMEIRYRNQKENFSTERAWKGQPRPFAEAFTWRKLGGGPPVNLALLALESLRVENGRMLTSKELSYEVGGRDVVTEHRLNAGLQVVSLIGLVRKHGYHRDPDVEQPVMTWSWKGALPLKRELINPIVQILSGCYLEPLPLKDLYSCNGNDRRDNTRTQFAPTVYIDSADKLQMRGYISLSMESRGGGRSCHVARSTEAGRLLVSDWVQTDVGQPLRGLNSERLRKVLLSI